MLIDSPYDSDHEDLPSAPDDNCDGINGGCTAGGQSHGTHVLGTLTANNNSFGVVGGAPSVYTLHVFSHAGCSAETASCSAGEVADGINNGVSPWGVDVINMSLIFFEYDVGIANAASQAWNAGILMAAAVGNIPVVDAGDRVWPAALPNVIAVSGVQDDGSFANTSPCNTASNSNLDVEISAPFWALSTTNGNSYQDEEYGWCGTSMATPHVSGTIALMRAKNPNLPNYQIRDILCDNAVDAGEPGWDPLYGCGIVDAFAAVAAVPSPLNVDIDGPNEIPVGDYCTWWANVTGGSGSTSYEWYRDGVRVGTASEYSFTASTTGTFSLSLDVTKGNETDGDAMVVRVTFDASSCGL